MHLNQYTRTVNQSKYVLRATITQKAFYHSVSQGLSEIVNGCARLNNGLHSIKHSAVTEVQAQQALQEVQSYE